eukprot:CFRG0755T1
MHVLSGLFVGPVVIGLSGFFALCFITGLEYANAIELLVTLVIGCEIAWYFYYRHRVLALSEKETIPAPFPEEHDDMFHKIVDFIVQHGNVFFPIWFKDRNVENITKSEFRAMFAANYHHKASAEMTEAQHEQFNSLLSIIVEKTGARFMAEDENSGRVHYDDTEPHPVGYMQHTRDSLQNVLCRNFWWYQYILFASEVPKNAIVVASLNDDIVPSQTVVDYLNEHSPDTHIIKPQYFHAEFLAHPHFIGELMSEVVKMENKASDTVIQRAVRGA